MFKFDVNMPDAIKLPVIRRVMPTIIASEIKGVSPMCAPKISIAELRARAYECLIADGMSEADALKEMNKK